MLSGALKYRVFPKNSVFGMADWAGPHPDPLPLGEGADGNGEGYRWVLLRNEALAQVDEDWTDTSSPEYQQKQLIHRIMQERTDTINPRILKIKGPLNQGAFFIQY